MNHTNKEIKKAIEIASSAFWADIAISFPEITNGDFSPRDTRRWYKACYWAVKHWLEFNEE